MLLKIDRNINSISYEKNGITYGKVSYRSGERIYVLNDGRHGISAYPEKEYFIKGKGNGYDYQDNKSYWLDGNEIYHAEPWEKNYEDVLDDLADGVYTVWGIIDEKKMNTNVIRIYRLLAGTRIEMENKKRLEELGEDTKNMYPIMVALANLIRNPGLHDPLSHKQIIPDYYHLISEGEKLWEGIEKPNWKRD